MIKKESFSANFMAQFCAMFETSSQEKLLSYGNNSTDLQMQVNWLISVWYKLLTEWNFWTEYM